ncbi:glycosyltransferase [Clostridia bacterium OttesenSCG-928-O13]|nr:glycosyltransferase [Clostridia bacterium OttesenSCG-928-O13]
MRVLVLSVTAGQGHNACAKAAMAALQAKGAECRMLDTLGYLNSLIGKGVDKGYLLMGKLSPGTFGRFYEASLASSEKHSGPQLADLITDGMAKKMADYIEDFKPDCILCTHVFAALVITHLRLRGMCGILSIGINTDFSIHPLWEQVDQDYFVLACAMMDYSAHLRGLDVDKILPFGLPVDAKFSQDITRQEARKQLGLPEKATLTIMSGSMGFGHLAQHIQNIDMLPLDFQMVAICGNNKDAYDEITALQQSGCFEHVVHCHGFVDNVHQFMHAGDILVTKPGGLSTTECLHVGRPMVLMEPIPGLEEYNAAFLVNCGAVVFAGDHYPLHEAVYNLLRSEERRDNMMRAQKAIHPGVAAELLAEFIVKNT